MSFQSVPDSGAVSPERMMREMPDTAEIQSVADAFRQLGDSTRLRIFWVLCHLEASVSGLAELVGMTSPAVSHHLRLLKNAGLVESTRSGKEMLYRAADNELAREQHHTVERLEALTCPEEELR